ncbi:MAG: hypothetical protein ACXACI_18135 [Candidatus Hodarchaeales archaeon]|jgi:hypothetical protein
MTEEEKLTELEWHRKMAAQLFNHTWALIDKGENRSKEESDEMIHAAHASRYHWTVVVRSGKYPKAGPKNLQAGDWLMSRVHTLLKLQYPGILYAQSAIDICEANNIGDYNLAWAYEAMARALSLTNDREDDLKTFLKKAKEAGDKIEKEEDRKSFFSELATIRHPPH